LDEGGDGSERAVRWVIVIDNDHCHWGFPLEARLRSLAEEQGHGTVTAHPSDSGVPLCLKPQFFKKPQFDEPLPTPCPQTRKAFLRPWERTHKTLRIRVHQRLT
jgi:hypothetical protein